MQPKSSRSDGRKDVDVLKAGVSVLVEAYLDSWEHEPKVPRRFLKSLAVKLNSESPPPVIGMTEVDMASPEGQEMRRWLLERLAVWMARVGA